MLHLEVIKGKTTNDLLNALKRFFARRGVPQIISSDQSKEFIRSSKELDLLWKGIDKKQLLEFAMAHKIDWRFGFTFTPQN